MRTMSARSTSIVAAASLATLALLLTGCSQTTASSTNTAFSAKASGSLAAWGFDNADDVGKARLAHAKAKLDGVTISIDQTAFDAQKFTTRVASGNIPDVVQMSAQFVATYAAQGLIMPLDKCYSAHDQNPDDLFYDSVVSDVTYDDHIYGVPQFYQPPAIILNERVMKAAGVTDAEINTSKPEELIAAVKKMSKSNGGNPSLLGFDPVAGGQPALWVLGYGGQIIGNNGKPTLDNPKNEKGIEVLKAIYDAEGGFAKAKSFSDSFDTFGDKNQFVSDQVGAQVDNQWYVNVLAPYVDTIDISAVPFYGSDGKPFTVSSGQAFVIPAGAKNKDAACAWALDLVSKGAWDAAASARAATLAKTPGAVSTGIFTGSPSIDKQQRAKYLTSSGNAGFDSTIATYYDVVGNGKSVGTSPAGQQIQTELQNAIQTALLGTKSPKAALADAQKSAMNAYNRAVKNAASTK